MYRLLHFKRFTVQYRSNEG